MKYTFVKSDGSLGHTVDFEQDPPVLPPAKGRWVKDIPPSYDATLYTLERVEPVSPTATHISYTLTPVPMEIAKKIARDKVNHTRHQAIRAGFEFMGKTIDSDDISIQNIICAAAAAQIAKGKNVPYDVTWTCADNTPLYLDAAGISDMMLTLSQHINECHTQSQKTKQDVEKASTETTDVSVVVETANSSNDKKAKDKK